MSLSFSKCRTLASLYFPSHLQDIEAETFMDCHSLAVITFGAPSNLRHIGNAAFLECEALHRISIPSFVESRDARAFQGSGIHDIQIAEENDHYRVSGDFLLSFDGERLIWYFGESSDVRIEDDIAVVCECAFSGRGDISAVEFGYGSQLRWVESTAFAGCRSLHSIALPCFVDRIDPGAFDGAGLREIRIAEGNSRFRVSGDVLLSFDGRFLICYFGRSSEILMEDDVEVICDTAFRGHKGLSAVEFGLSFDVLNPGHSPIAIHLSRFVLRVLLIELMGRRFGIRAFGRSKSRKEIATSESQGISY
jgi:hypothetical protein